MRTFGGFRLGDEFFYAEVHGDAVHILENPYWIDIEPTGETTKLSLVDVDLPVAPGKLIAVGLNYADHIKEMQRTPLGTPLIWFKAPSSLLPHGGTIEIAFPEHQTDFEVELGIVLGTAAKNVSVARALEHVFGYTIAEDISDRDLQKSEKQFGRCKSFDTYTPVGPFVHTEVEVERSADHASAERRSETTGAHEPDDLFRGGDCLLRQSIDHARAGRPYLDRHAFRGRPDSRG